jgi:hypothetical protein
MEFGEEMFSVALHPTVNKCVYAFINIDIYIDPYVYIQICIRAYIFIYAYLLLWILMKEFGEEIFSVALHPTVRIYIYIYTHFKACIYVYMHIICKNLCAYAYVWICIHGRDVQCSSMCKNICICIYIYICIYTYTLKPVYMYKCIYFVCIHIHIYVYISTLRPV